jgi:hypothetical protein
LLPKQTVEELLSLAPVQAITGQAGVSMSYFDPDYGFDGTFRSIRARGSRLVTQGLAVDFQLKDFEIIKSSQISEGNVMRPAERQ